MTPSNLLLRIRGARRIVASLSVLFVLASLVHADVLIWDANTITADAQDGTGTWTSGAPNWFNFTQNSQNQNWLDGSDAVFGAGSGTAGTITLSGPITAGNLTFNAATTGTYTLGGTGTLTLVNSTITNNAASTISAVIAGSTPWIKTGAGQLTLSGSSPNTHTGTLSVNAGRVHLNKVGALAGNLEINTGGFVTFSGGTNQMAATSSVTLNGAASVFNGTGPNATVGTVTQTLASLTVTGGTFNAGANSVWNIGSLSFGPGENKVFVGNSGTTVNAGSLSLVGMNGAASSTDVLNGFTLFGNGVTTITRLTVGSGGLYLEGSNIHMGRGSRGAEMYLNGDVSTGGTTTSTIQISQSGAVLPFLGLSGSAGTATRTFNIAGGGANLSINVAVTNGSATTASLVKNGAGTLTLSGAEANTYSGDTTVNAGVLQLNKTAGVAAVSGNIILNAGGTLTLSANNQIADTKGITVNGGTISSFTTDETIAFYTQNSGGFSASANTGHLIVTGALTLAGGNTLTLNSNAVANPASLTVDSAILTGADILLGGNNGAANPRTSLTIGPGGLAMAGRTITLNVGTAGTILNLNGDFTGTGTNNISNGGGSGVQPLVQIGAATRTFNVINGTTTISAEVAGSGGSVVKTGNGLFQLTAANTYSGTTTVSGGTLSVAGAAGTLASTTAVAVNNGATFQIGSSVGANNNGLANRINSAATLTLGGGTASLMSAATGAHTQSLASLTINGGANTVNVTAAAATTATLTFSGASPYVRTGGSVNFVQNPGVGGSIVLTNAPSGAGNVTGGVLVGATLNGTDLVAAQSGVVTAFSGWIPTGTGTWTTSGAMDVTGTNGTAYAATNITALRFNTAGPFTVALDGTHTVNSDVVLMTPNAGAGTALITGGTLQGTSGGDLAVSQNNTAGSLEIASTLANNTTTTGLVKSGAGLLVLSGTNTYTGTTRVMEGTLRAAEGVGLPTSSALALANGVFESTASTFNRSLGTTAGSVSIGGGTTGFSAFGTPVTVNLGGSAATLQWGSTSFNPATLLLNSATANAALELANGLDLNGVGRSIRVDANVATISGIISNSVPGSPASLTKAGAGTLRLTQANTYDGGTFISAGLVALGHNQALGGGTVTLGGGGLQADGTARAIANNVVITAPSNVTSSQSLTINGSFTNSGGTQTLTTGLTGGAILTLAGNVYLSESAATSRTLQFGGSGDRLISGVIANNAGTNTLGSNIFFNGGGTLSLTGTNTYTGRTLATGGGYLVINQDRSLGAAPASPLVDNLILAANGRLRASTSFTLDANRGIGIGASSGGTATGDIDVVSSAVFRVAGTVANRTLNHDGAASGSNVGSLNKTGAGVLELSGTNTYSGLTSVSEGILRVLSNNGLGTSDGGVTVASTAHVELGHGVKVSGETITLNTTMGTTGTGSLASSRGGLQAAAGARAEWAGDVIIGINQGRIGVQEGGFLNVSGNITDGANNFSVRLTGETTGTGGLMISGTGNAWDGETELVRGKVFLGANNALPTNTILDIHFSNTNNTEYAGLDMNGFNQTVASLRNDGASGAFADLTNSSRTLSTMTVNETGSVTYGGMISGNVALVKTGAGTLTLSLATNRFTGGATVNEGTLRITSATALVEGNVTVNGGAAASGKFDINNVSNAINALNGVAGTVNGIVANESATNATRILSIGVNHGSGSYAGTIIDNSGGSAQGKVSLAKIGAGTQTLSGNGTYSGATLVSNGTLIADYAAGTPLGSSAITLQGGTMVVRNATTTSIGNLSLLQSGADFTNNVMRIEGTGTVTTSQFSAGGFAPLLLDISSGSTLVATTLLNTTVTNGVLLGSSARSTLFVQDATGVGFATRNGSNQIVRYTGASALPSGSATTSNTANYIVSGDLSRTAALNFQTLQIDTASADVTLSLGASNLVPSGGGRTILITGNNDATISATTGAATGGSLFIANHGTGTTTLGLSLAGQAVINAGPGLLDYTNAANPADFYAAGGVSRFSGADRNFDTGILRIYGGGVLEIGADLSNTVDGDFVRAVGTAAGQVSLLGNGGFSAHGADRVVALGGVGTAAALTWGSTSFLTGNGGDNNYTFMLGSASSTHTLEFQNAINLGSRERRVEVADGVNAGNVDARLTGVLSGAGGSLIKEGAGRLEISAASTYSGATRVNAGSLLVSATGRTGTGAVTVAANASLMGSGVVQGSSFALASNATMHAGNGTLASNIGTLAFQTTAAASFEIQNGSLVMLDLGTSTNQATIDASFGGNAIGSAGYNAYVDAFSGTGSGSHDLLTFDGAAGSTLSFSGRLSVRPGASFSASYGQVFNLLDWGTLVGADFSGFNVGTNYRSGADDDLLQFDLPELTGGLVWDVSRFTTSGVIVVIPEPGRTLLLMLGLLGLFMRRRR